MENSTSYTSTALAELAALKKGDGEVMEFVPMEIFVNNKSRKFIEIILDMTINFLLSLTGIITNVLVIIVFIRQGLKDSIAIAMTTIAVWDFFKCLGGFMQRMVGPISLWNSVAAFSWGNISAVIFNYLVSFSTYVTSVLAAYVAVERCLCVTIPLKVKWLLTPKLALTICVVISVVVFGYFCVIFGIYDIVWGYNPRFNATVAIYRYNRFSTNNTDLFHFYNMSGAMWPLASLVVIVISTVIISYKLKKASEFRYGKSEGSAPSADNEEQARSDAKNSKNYMSKRDQQVIKMLLVIIAIFIVNLTPRVVHYMAKYFIPDFYYLRKYHNLMMVSSYIVLFFDFLNGAVNLMVFFSMSSAFRTTYIEIFPFFCNKEKNQSQNIQSYNAKFE